MSENVASEIEFVTIGRDSSTLTTWWVVNGESVNTFTVDFDHHIGENVGFK